MDAEAKANRLFEISFDTVEDFVDRFSTSSDESKAQVLSLLMAVSFCSYIDKLGWLKGVRALLGLVLVGIKYKKKLTVF